jgi:hypothetical protein
MTTFTRTQKHLMRNYALYRERANGIVAVRFLPSGDARAYCEDGETYLIAPTAELLKEASRNRRREAQRTNRNQ